MNTPVNASIVVLGSRSVRRDRLGKALIVLAAVAVACCAPPAVGQTLYTVNTLADTLVSINAATGATATVGPIGYDMHATDLTYLNGNLYAVTANSDAIFNNPGFTLLTINPSSGAMTNSVNLSLNGNMPNLVESLGNANGNLYIGFSPTGTVSTDVGQLNPTTGVITHDVNYSAIPGVNNFYGSFGVDLDGMSGEPNGTTLLTLDTDNSTFISIVRIDPVNVTASPVSQTTIHPGQIDDLVATSTAVYMIGGGDLYRMNAGGTTLLQTLALNPAGSYLGLAVVPEPSTFVLGALGLLCLVAKLLRRASP